MKLRTKHHFAGLNFDDSDRKLQEGDYIHSLNLIPSKPGDATATERENIKGNVLIPNILPAGDNVCIGSYEDVTANRLIYFIWNSNGNHNIYQFLYASNAVQKIFEWSGLGFDKDKKVNGVGVTEDLLYWCVEGQDLKMINIERAISGGYEKQSQNEITVLKKPPTFAILPERLRTSAEYNFIFDKSFQFVYRNVYLDNEVSALSPISEVSLGEYGADSNYGLLGFGYDNTIRLNVKAEFDILPILKSIEVFVREFNTGVFKLAKNLTIGSSETSSLPMPDGGIMFYVNFRNDSVGYVLSSSESVKTIDAVPRISNSLSLFEGRIFTVADKEGFNVNPEDFTFNTSISRTSQVIYANPNHNRNDITFFPSLIASGMFFKENGRYKAGLVFKDDGNRRSSVYGAISINITLLKKEPSHSDTDRFFIEGAMLGVSPDRPGVNWAISGKPPEWATRYSIVRTEELSYSKYYQFGARLEFLHEKPKWFEGRVLDKSEQYIGLNGNEEFVYYKKPTTRGGLVHIKLPKNMPFIPAIGDEVRVVMDYNLDKSDSSYKVKNVYSDVIEVEVFNFFSFLGDDHGKLSGGEWETAKQVVMIELFSRQKSALEDIFYETGETFNVSNPGTEERAFSKMSGSLNGDTYYVYLKDVYPDFKVFYDGDTVFNATLSKHIESPSPQLTEAANEFNHSPTFATGTLDYSKSVSDIGFPNVVVRNAREMNRYTSIRYSNPFVQNSLINGYSSFDELNEHLLPIENGKVRKLIPVGGVLLAIHERYTSSMYINEGFINTGDGQQFLSKTENVVGDDRTMIQSYGTINPESVDVHDGKAWWWDAHNGEVVRYANGLTPLASTFKAKEYFAQKSRERLKYKETSKVYGKYHPYLDLYILTFAPVGEFPGETIAFSEKYKRWITFFSFVPENYGRINTELISFKSGHLWVHERSEIRNNFYGTDNPSELTFLSNEESTYKKRWDNITLDSSEAWDVDFSNEDQFTDLIKDEFQLNGGNWYTYLRRDKNTPAEVLNPGESGLLSGWPIESQTLKVTVKNNNNQAVTLDSVYIMSQKLAGQHL